MSDKIQRNIWIVSAICFTIAFIGRFSDEGFTVNTLLQGVVAILSFINLWIRQKRIKEVEVK